LKRIAFVLDYYPYMGGYSKRVAEQLRVLSARYELHLIYLFRKGGDESVDVSKYAKEHRVDAGVRQRDDSSEMSRNPLRLLSSPRLVVNMLKNVLSFRSPVYYAPYVSDRVRGEVERIIEREGIDIVWANGVIGSLMAGRARGKLRVLDMCDSRYLLYSSLRPIERSLLRKAFMLLDGALARGFERDAPKRNDIVLYICRRDGLAAGLKEGGFTVLPNIRPDSKVERLPKKTDIIMLGRWDYLPNLDSLDFAVREILPKMKRGVTVEIVGMMRERERQSLQWASRGASNSRLVIAGVVDDIFPRLSGSRMMLAPVRAGAGVQNKIRDAAEAGIPVLTTPFSKSAIDPEGRCEGIVSCSGAADFAKAADRILSDPEEEKRLGRACRSFYESYNAESRKRHAELMDRIDARVGT
jgi:glycosyltransferase involved in cell wall biosynthesis